MEDFETPLPFIGFNTLFPEFLDYPYLVEALSPVFKRHILRPGQLLLQAGDVGDRFYFIVSGMVRGFYYNDNDNDNDNNNDNDNSITSWFEAEGGYVMVPHSYFGGEPSQESIEVLEAGVALSITLADARQLHTAHPTLGMVSRLVMARYMIEAEYRLRALRLTTVEQRVDFFRQRYPAIYRRAPLKHIASFLNMTPQTLSKIRGKRN